MLSLLLLAAATSAPSAPVPAPAKPAAPAVDLQKLRAGCSGGTPADCVALGRALPAQSEEGLAALEKACARDAFDGCFLLAARAAGLEGGARDDARFALRYDRAVVRAEKRCLAGDADACRRLGAWEGTTLPGPADPWAALAAHRERFTVENELFLLRERRCVDGDARACLAAGRALSSGAGAALDPAGAAARFAKACAGGEGEACQAQAEAKLDEAGAPLDEAKLAALKARARDLLRARCEAGGGRACRQLAELQPATGEAAALQRRGIDAAYEKNCGADPAACREWWDWLQQSKADAARAELPACEAGVVEACAAAEKRVGESIDEKAPVSIESLHRPALAYMRLEQARARACLAGELPVCAETLPGELRTGFFAPENAAQAETLIALVGARLARRCGARESEACERRARLAAAPAAGLFAAERARRALDWAARRCAAGRQEGCVEYQRRRLAEGAGGDPARAEKKFSAARSAAEAGCADGRGDDCYAALLADTALAAGEGRGAEAALRRRADRVLAAFEGGWLCADTGLPECMMMLMHAAISFDEPELAWKRTLALLERLPELMEPACQRGEGRACLLLGFLRGGGLRKIFTRGEGAEREKGEEVMRQAEGLLVHFENHWGLKPDEAAGAALMKRGGELLGAACTRGELEACIMARLPAAMAGADEAGDEDDEAAMQAVAKSIKTACDEQGGAPCRRMWQMLERGEWPARIARACEGGDPRGCLAAGWLAAVGRDATPADYAAAAAVFERACAAREGSGCRMLYNFRRAGMIEGSKDPAADADLPQRGCDGGDLISCRYIAGQWLRESDKIPAQWERARALYDRNCAAGDAQSCGILGRNHRNGASGFAKDPVRARHYLEKACVLGEHWSCELLKPAEAGDDEDD